MDTQSLDGLFRQAVTLVDSGGVARLEQLLASNPGLAIARLDAPGPWLRDKVGGALDGFFRSPYLLWFVAEDPVRNGTLPANIANVAKTIIHAARRETADLKEQLDAALRLVAWSWIARQCGVQIALIDVLVDAGASPDGMPDNALVNRNEDAAEHLVRRGAPLTLATALCLGRWDALAELVRTATAQQKQFAFVLAALNGKAEALQRMIDAGAADVNLLSQDLYSHGTPLHHAVSSGSLDAVRVLMEAGAALDTKDTAWHGTPLGWAEHYVGEKKDGADRQRYEAIASYLRQRIAHV